MRPALVNWLVCPDCRAGSLAATTFELDLGAKDAEEVLAGSLVCGDCGAWYPIIGGVPRMLPSALRSTLPDTYPDFYRSYADQLPGAAGSDSSPRDDHTEGQVQVMEAFGFEWNEFADYENDNFLEWVSPLEPEFFDGKLGLDGGCGAGRHAVRARGFGATVIAMDISAAVDATQAKARVNDGIYVVQGDLFDPPIKPGILDFVYSIGVIHHTPDPPRAFRSIVSLLAPGGTVACFVYASGRPIALGVLGAIRKVTTRLPLPATKGLSLLAAAVDTAGPITAYRLVRRAGAKPATLERLFPEHVRIYADRTFATNYTDWLDRLSYPFVHYYTSDELQGWLDDAGLRQTTLTPIGKNGITCVGVVPSD
jgi:SAM-dependent methyltransferase